MQSNGIIRISFLKDIFKNKYLNSFKGQSFAKTYLYYEPDSASKKIYLNRSQIMEMYKNSMTFGSHGCTHSWFEYLNAKKQNEEIKNSINYFKKIKVYNENFSFCYLLVGQVKFY